MIPVQVPDPRPLAGEPFALDLLNTQWMASGSPADLLATMEGTRAWLTAAAIAAVPAPETRHALVTARQAISDVLTAQGGPAALERLNQVLGHGRLRLSIGPPANPEQTLEVDDPAWRPAVMAAANLLELLEQAPDRIRRCQHPACVLWFYDTTRNGTRRWCSMATCGNRAKANRHYDRAKKHAHPAGSENDHRNRTQALPGSAKHVAAQSLSTPGTAQRTTRAEHPVRCGPVASLPAQVDIQLGGSAGVLPDLPSSLQAGCNAVGDARHKLRNAWQQVTAARCGRGGFIWPRCGLPRCRRATC